jgi:hypothetical protein
MVHLTSCSGYKNSSTSATREREEIIFLIGYLFPFACVYMCSLVQGMCHLSHSRMEWCRKKLRSQMV